MAQLPAENSTLARAVRRAAEQGRLSHAIVLSGDGDLLDAARFIAAAHVCGEEGKPCLRWVFLAVSRKRCNFGGRMLN